MLSFKLSVNTHRDDEFIDITHLVNAKISESRIKDGIAIVFCPHTTAAITINENADPDVLTDMIKGLNSVYPENKNYKHMEGNSHAHLKSSSFGCSETIIIEKGKLLLGTWQGIYFCEFDGPRNRTVYLKLING